jgi:ABC-type multidrug transport system fused ATPase/permease subunit
LSHSIPGYNIIQSSNKKSETIAEKTKDEDIKMENTNKKESKLQAISKGDNPKLSMILNAITAAIWIFITAMNLYSLNEYAHVNTFSPYFSGALALFYTGMTLECACKYAKAKKLEGGE